LINPLKYAISPGREDSGKKQLPGPDRRRPDAYMPEVVEDYAPVLLDFLNPERPNPETCVVT
jgi:hypothetical protein